LKHLIHILCKSATYLISKKEEGKLTILEWLRLQFHLSICSFCKLFQQQTKFIGKNAHGAHEFNQVKLSDEVKLKIAMLLKEASE
jgi:hypothetical protein